MSADASPALGWWQLTEKVGGQDLGHGGDSVLDLLLSGDTLGCQHLTKLSGKTELTGEWMS